MIREHAGRRELWYAARVQAVVLAGGLATRLGPLTRETPKSLLVVAGRPFLAWQLDALKSSGFSRVVLCIGHMGERIREFAEDGAAFGLALEYSEDGPSLLGTAGALRRALPRLEDTFLVTYGDSYLPFDYSAPLRDLVAHPEALGTMSVFENQGRWDTSNCRVEGELVVSYEKNSGTSGFAYIDYGAIALRREVVAALRENQATGLDTLQHELAARGRLRAFLAHERFYEIGSEAGLRELAQRLGHI